MTVSFTRTRNQIADLVLRKVGVAVAGVTAASADAQIIYDAIDMRLKEMHRLGLYWRKVNARPVEFTLPASTISASAASVGDMLYPVSLYVTVNSLDEPVAIISPTEYASIENKTQTGEPEKAMWTGNQSAEFIVWPIPTASRTLKLTYEAITTDTSASAAADIDVAMIRWMKDIIAYDVGDDFEVSEDKMMRFEREAIIAERNIRKLGNPKVSLTPVAVDDWSSSRRSNRDYRLP